ncbi:MAG: helix-hairpin-helix domain-containing protein [Chloroflexi bacterium]|nr:helix-hairpin-helix domain-containing protein [Chloroflexota bacterium]
MKAEKPAIRYSGLIIVALLSIILTAGLLAWSRSGPGQTIRVTAGPGDGFTGRVYIGGAVRLPGFYPVKGDDTIAGLIQAAGGPLDGAGLDELELALLPKQPAHPQKVNLNTADVWLLQALPGIGETRARAIARYRERQGLFRSTGELLKVEGIGPAIFERLSGLITVAD